MKKIVSFLIICVMILTTAAYAMPRPYAITVVVDGNKLEFDVPPRSENGRTLVPMRVIFEALGAKVEWVGEESKVVATKADTIIELVLGSNIMTKNGEEIVLDVPAKAIDGRTLVPARAVSEALDATVLWDADTYTVNITSSAPYVSGEYHYTELSERDMETLRSLYPELFRMYAAEVLYDNMMAYPNDVAELINFGDARIRMFADDVWNNLMSHAIINIQTESDDMYIFDIPEEVEIESYTLMEDYFAITDKEQMSAEYALESELKKFGNKNVLEIKFGGHNAFYGTPNIEYVFVVAGTEDFRYFYAMRSTSGDVTEQKVYEITKDEHLLIDEATADGWKSGALSHQQIIENAIAK